MVSQSSSYNLFVSTACERDRAGDVEVLPSWWPAAHCHPGPETSDRSTPPLSSHSFSFLFSFSKSFSSSFSFSLSPLSSALLTFSPSSPTHLLTLSFPASPYFFSFSSSSSSYSFSSNPSSPTLYFFLFYSLNSISSFSLCIQLSFHQRVPILEKNPYFSFHFS